MTSDSWVCVVGGGCLDGRKDIWSEVDRIDLTPDVLRQLNDNGRQEMGGQWDV